MMRSQEQVWVGLLIMVAGLVILLAALFNVNIGAFCFPLGLILLGTYLLLRPQLAGPDTGFHVAVFGPVRRDGAWQVTDLEIWIFVGDVRLDLTQAQIPWGETQIRLFGIVGDIRLLVPDGVGVSARSLAFVSDGRLLGQKRDSIMAPLHMTSEGYEAAERQIHLETVCFVSNIRVLRSE